MKGTVGAVSKKGNSLMISGKWYSQFKPFEPIISKGDSVEFEYEENYSEKDGITYNNIKSITSLHMAPKDISQQYSQSGVSLSSTTSFPQIDKDTLIVRQSCLKAAIELANAQLNRLGTEVLQEHVKKILDQIKVCAEDFEKWVFRKGDTGAND